jgi:hypothetical protein
MLAILTGGIIGGLFGLVRVVVGVAAFVFWIWMLIHAITNKGLSGAGKIVWVLVILFLPCLGALIYYFVGRPKATG